VLDNDLKFALGPASDRHRQVSSAAPSSTLARSGWPSWHIPRWRARTTNIARSGTARVDTAVSDLHLSYAHRQWQALFSCPRLSVYALSAGRRRPPTRASCLTNRMASHTVPGSRSWGPSS